MAYANDIRATHNGIFDRLATLFANLAERRARYAVYRETEHELNGLSDRDLSDLGLSRSSIKAVAYEAAYTN